MAISIGMQQFAKRWREDYLRRVQPAVDRIQDKATIEAANQVVYRTPADTGRARSNWRGGSPRAPKGTRAPYAPGNKLGLGETKNAMAALEQIKSATMGRKPGAPFEIGNNLDYISLLNDGSSSQAPANFVGTGVIAAVDTIRRSDLRITT